MSVYRPKGSPFYHYDFQFKGRRFHGSCGLTSKPLALRYEAKMREEAALGPGRKPVTLDDAAGAYFLARIDGHSIAKTVEYQMLNLIGFFGKARLLGDIPQAEFLTYIARRRAQVSPASVNREVQLARAVWRFADEVMDRDTGRKVNWRALMLKEPEPPKRELSAEDEKRLVDALRPDIRPLVLFALASGLRLSGCIGLRWADVDMDAKTLRTEGKGGKTLAKPMSRQMAAIIGSQPKVGAFVFTYLCAKSRDRRKAGERYPFTATGWRREWAAALTAAGLEGFRFHDLRHTFGTRLLRATGNLGLVRAALDHSDISTTLRYAHVLDDDLRAGLEAMEAETPKVRRAE